MSPHALLLTLAAAQAAPVRHVTDVALAHEGEDLEVRVAADGPLTVDRVHSGAGRLRVWFASAEVADMDRPGDGQGVRFLRAYGGVRGSTVVVVRHRAPTIPAGAVRVVPDAGGARILFERALVSPPAPEPAPQPARLASTETAAPPEPVTPASVEPQRATSTAAPAPGAAAAAPRPRGRPPIARVSAPPASRGGAALWIAAALGAAGLFVVARWARRRSLAKADPTSIAVLSRVRLGAKHEIVVVRALGRDHLVAFGDGSVRRIASQSGRASPIAADLEEREGPTDLSLPPTPPPDEDRLPAPIPRYGRVGTIAGAGFAAGPRESDAVAGIVRLRRAAGG